MDRYTKGFVVASLVYFFLASVLGMWMGGASAPAWAQFAHVHFNLLGFMSMMIYGVGYFILPRFNGRTLKWPGMVPIHFYVANIGLVGMVATAPERPSTGFLLFAALSVISVALFVVNLGATMLINPQDEEEAEAAPQGGGGQGPARAATSSPVPPNAEIHPDMRVGEILSRWPATVEVFVANGFASLGNPEHREQVKQIPITLRMACQRHNVDLDAILEKLIAASEGRAPAAVGAGAAAPSRGAAARARLTRGEMIRPDNILGEILSVYPETEKVFKRYYGAGCFSCPGQGTESVKQSAMMHNVDAKLILADLNKAAGF